MAGSGGVWGIEVGQSALKALHCVKSGDEIVADGFDFIEYPKLLSQPEADPDQLVAEALLQLLERNDSIRDRVCISVPGQSGLAKFFKPPPVELKKIADIVRYEAKQQIPFELSDVVWDFQTMPGATIQEGVPGTCATRGRCRSGIAYQALIHELQEFYQVGSRTEYGAAVLTLAHVG